MTTSTEQAARFTLDKIRNGVPGVGIGPMTADVREHVQLVTDDDLGAAFRRVEPTITSTYETDRDGRTWIVGHTTDGLHFATWAELADPDASIVQHAVFTRDLGILLDTLTKNFPVGPLTTTSDEHVTDEWADVPVITAPHDDAAPEPDDGYRADEPPIRYIPEALQDAFDADAREAAARQAFADVLVPEPDEDGTGTIRKAPGHSHGHGGVCLSQSCPQNGRLGVLSSRGGRVVGRPVTYTPHGVPDTWQHAEAASTVCQIATGRMPVPSDEVERDRLANLVGAYHRHLTGEPHGDGVALHPLVWDVWVALREWCAEEVNASVPTVRQMLRSLQATCPDIWFDDGNGGIADLKHALDSTLDLERVNAASVDDLAWLDSPFTMPVTREATS